MLTEKDIKLHVYYGDGKKFARISAFTWNDGPYGVNFDREGMCTMLPMFCSKQDFLDHINNGTPLNWISG